MQWLQASLPVRDMAVWGETSFALPAFLASGRYSCWLHLFRQCLFAVLCATGYQLLALSLMFCRLNNLSGTVPVLWQTIVQVKSNLSTLSQLLAASFSHSRDWLHAMPISSCGLRLDNETVTVGVGLRLGLSLCEPHKCHRGSLALFARRLQEDRSGTTP